MKFNLEESLKLLERTPSILETLLADLSEEWILSNEGVDTFSPFDVVGHLVHGEKTDWLTRAEIILSSSENKNFQPYDRFAQYEESKDKTIYELLSEFKVLRIKNVASIRAKKLTEEDLNKTGIHPKFGEVTLKQLISTWTIHDLAHIAQICRVMANQYTDEVGPWKEYLNILKR